MWALGREGVFFSFSKKQKSTKKRRLSHNQPTKISLFNFKKVPLLSSSFFRIFNRKQKGEGRGGGRSSAPRGDGSPAYFDKRDNLITCIKFNVINYYVCSQPGLCFFLGGVRAQRKAGYVRRKYVHICVIPCSVTLYAAEMGFVGKKKKKKSPQTPVYLNGLGQRRREREREGGRNARGKLLRTLCCIMHMNPIRTHVISPPFFVAFSMY